MKFEDLNLSTLRDTEILNRMASELIGEKCTFKDVHMMHYLTGLTTPNREIGMKVIYRFQLARESSPGQPMHTRIEDIELAKFMDMKTLQKELPTNNNNKEKRVKI